MYIYTELSSWSDTSFCHFTAFLSYFPSTNLTIKITGNIIYLYDYCHERNCYATPAQWRSIGRFEEVHGDVRCVSSSSAVHNSLSIVTTASGTSQITLSWSNSPLNM